MRKATAGHDIVHRKTSSRYFVLFVDCRYVRMIRHGILAVGKVAKLCDRMGFGNDMATV
jgi:hypothetical protein